MSGEGKTMFTLHEKDEETLDDSTPEPSPVQFISRASIEIKEHPETKPPSKSRDPEFRPLNREELLEEYEDDPYWRRVRIIMVIIIVVTWVCMLAAAIALIVMAPKCPPREDLQWWQSSVIYQVYPRSFKDSDGDGVGDIQGIIDKLDYIKETVHADVIYLNAIYPSGGQDTGFDVTNHTDIDPIFGTMEKFMELLGHMKEKSMKLIMDFVPNHTSKDHPWFKKSEQKDGVYADYYVWHPGTNSTANSSRPAPPNNWISNFKNASAWSWCDVREEYYLHQFLPEQPDLNVRNPKVRQELKEILSFWLNKGVHGFRVSSAIYLFETADLTEDEPICKHPNNKKEGAYDNLDHNLTTYQPETYELITEWRELLDNVSAQGDVHYDRLLMVELYHDDVIQTLQMASYKGKPGAHMPTNAHLLMGLRDKCQNASCVSDLVEKDLETKGLIWPNYQTGNHDWSRLASNTGSDPHSNVKVILMLLLTLPGTPIIYYGDEIGMHDVPVPDHLREDMAWPEEPRNRDPERTPMQWSTQPLAGFTSGNSTWLPVCHNFNKINVHSQDATNAGTTTLEVFSAVSKLSKEPSFQWGRFQSTVAGSIYFYIRQARGFDGFLVALNFGPDMMNINFQKEVPTDVVIPEKGWVAVHTGGDLDGSELGVGKEVKLDNIQLKPSQGIIFRWAPEAVGQQM